MSSNRSRRAGNVGYHRAEGQWLARLRESVQERDPRRTKTEVPVRSVLEQPTATAPVEGDIACTSSTRLLRLREVLWENEGQWIQYTADFPSYTDIDPDSVERRPRSSVGRRMRGSTGLYRCGLLDFINPRTPRSRSTIAIGREPVPNKGGTESEAETENDRNEHPDTISFDRTQHSDSNRVAPSLKVGPRNALESRQLPSRARLERTEVPE